MKKAIIGKKVGMTQIFDEKGNVIPVTVVEAGPCTVVQKKTAEIDGYEAVQIGFGDVKIQRVNKPLTGHFKKADVAPKKHLKEFRLADMITLNVGDVVKADIFAAGDTVDVHGTSKGKGTAGVIKRWNHGRLKESHGTGGRRPSRMREGHRSESHRCEGRRGEQPACHQRRRSRPQRRHRCRVERSQESVREET